MKIAHTADVHISDKSHISVLGKIVERANASGCAHLLIAGDLFDSNEDAKTYSAAVGGILSGFKGSTWVIPGNHDMKTGTYLFVERGKVFKSVEALTLSADLILLGIPYIENKGFFDLVVEKTIEKQPKKTILLIHGTIRSGSRKLAGDEHFPVMIDDLEQFGCLYAALGHYHVPVTEKTGGLLVVNPGSPRVTRSSDYGRRKFVIFDTDKASYSDCFLDVPYNERVIVDVDFLMGIDAVKDRISSAVKKTLAGIDRSQGSATLSVRLAGTLSLPADELSGLSAYVERTLAGSGIGFSFDLSEVRIIGEEVLSDPSVKELLASVAGSRFGDKKELQSFTVRLLSELYAGKL
jgi:predicted phosphodiesterase